MKVIKVDGIYDRRTLDFLISQGVHHLGFDFRPKSLNFIQGKNFLNLIEEFYTPQSKIYLKFSDQPSFMIEKVLSDLENTLGRNDLKKNVILEFTLPPTDRNCWDFKYDYMLQYEPELSIKKHVDHKNFTGMTLDYDFLNRLNMEGSLENFTQNLFTQIYEKNSRFCLNLKRNWDSNIFPSLEESIDFNFWTLPINPLVEVCYRNVDLKKVERSLSFCFQGV